MIIKHNISAMDAGRMLHLTGKNQTKSIEKLSSGYKINRAADDAAGLSISEKMRRQVKGLTRAAANAMDGISCVQTAEGALNEVHDMLQRMEELAVKGANGTLTATDRGFITAEVRQLMSEIDRIQSTTTFNEQNLLDGTFRYKGLQVGAEPGQHITVTIGDMSANELIAKALAKGIYYHTNDESPLCHRIDFPNPTTVNYPPGALAYWIPGNGTTWAKQEYWDKSMVLPWGYGHSHLLGAYDLTIFHGFSYSAISDQQVKNRLTTTYPANTTGGTEEPMEDKTPDVRYFQALNAFAKSAISDVSETRSMLGAVQNRLEHTINNLNNIVENTAAAESAIRDTDFGVEMINFSNNSIILQSGQSVLAQANQKRQGVLELLG